MNFLGTLMEAFGKVYGRVLSSIAFFPVIITVGLFVISLLITSDIGEQLSLRFVEVAPGLSINDVEVARAILSTLIGGILSLTVFSFSMVMVVLNQASSNFSPRLLPGLISDKRHQIILGIYTGTLLYCIMVMINMGTSGDVPKAVGLSAMVAAVLGVVCVALFVYFIHSISESIQVNTIIDATYYGSLALLEDKLEHQIEATSKGEQWTTYYSRETGYFRGVQKTFLPNLSGIGNLTIELIPYIDEHVWTGMPLFRISDEVDKSELDKIYHGLRFSPDRHDGDDYLGGMVKLMEVAVKAMSPGVNDPGTAIDSLVKLGELINKAIKVCDRTQMEKEADSLSVIINNIQVEQLFRLLVQPIRHYSKGDASVLGVLINCLKSIKKRHLENAQVQEVISTEFSALKQAVESSFSVQKDREALLRELEV